MTGCPSSKYGMDPFVDLGARPLYGASFIVKLDFVQFHFTFCQVEEPAGPLFKILLDTHLGNQLISNDIYIIIINLLSYRPDENSRRHLKHVKDAIE